MIECDLGPVIGSINPQPVSHRLTPKRNDLLERVVTHIVVWSNAAVGAVLYVLGFTVAAMALHEICK